MEPANQTPAQSWPAPPPGSLEHWAYRYVTSTSLEEKLAPEPAPATRARQALRSASPRPVVRPRCA